MKDVSNNINYKIEELDKKLNSNLKLLEQSREDVLTSDQVCEKLDIGKTHLWKLDKEGITEPFPHDYSWICCFKHRAH
jgi:hypothetical protein